jgi:hypothetical protein
MEQPWQQMGHAPPSSPLLALDAWPITLEVPLTFLIFAFVATAMAYGMGRWRRTAALGLALVLGLFVLGIAIHSVHHLSDPAKATECLVFLASQYVSGTLNEPVNVAAARFTISTACCPMDDALPLALGFRSDLPRGPPSVPA